VHNTVAGFFLIKQGEKEGLPACVKMINCAQDMLEQHSGKMALAEHIKKMEGCNDAKKSCMMRWPTTSWEPVRSLLVLMPREQGS